MGSTVAYGPVLALTVYLHAAVVLIPTPGNAGAAEGLFYLIFSSEGAEGVFWALSSRIEAPRFSFSTRVK